MSIDDPRIALAKAVEHAGSQSELARQIGVSQNAVSRWLRLGKSLPDKHVLKVEGLTGVSKHDLRPDLYPRDPAPAPAAGRHGDMEPAR